MKYGAGENRSVGSRIPFELSPIDQVHPWGEERSLHWFNLIQGWYGGRRHRAAHLLHTLPSILDPVPADLAELFTAGTSEWTDSDDDLIDAAYEAHRLRRVDTGYLQYGPHFQWCRTLHADDRVTARWTYPTDPEGVIAFTAPTSGHTSVSTAEFLTTITDFDHLMKVMQERVDQLITTGPPPRTTLDVQNLTWQQENRRTELSRRLAHQVDTDWDPVRAGIAILAPDH